MNWNNRIGMFGTGVVSGIVLCIAILINTERNTVPQFSVSVLNNSKFEITEIRIENKSGYLVYKGLVKKAQITLPVFAQGEGAYSILATLENGVTLAGGVAYVESGYATREVVFGDRIESQIISVY